MVVATVMAEVEEEEEWGRASSIITTCSRRPASPLFPRHSSRLSCRRFKVQRSSTGLHLWHSFSCSRYRLESAWLPRPLLVDLWSIMNLRPCFGHPMDHRVSRRLPKKKKRKKKKKEENRKRLKIKLLLYHT